MKLETTAMTVAGPYRYRRPRKRPLVGPTGSPWLDSTLVLQTKSCRWFRQKSSDNSTKRVSFRE